MKISKFPKTTAFLIPLIFFVLIYFDQFQFGNYRLGYVWKAFLLIFFVANTYKRLNATLIFLTLLLSLKIILNKNPFYYPVENIAIALSFWFLPLSIYFFHSRFQNKKSELLKLIFKFCTIIILMNIPIFVGLVSAPGRTYDLSIFGIKSINGFSGLFLHVNIAAKIFVVTTIILIHAKLKKEKVCCNNFFIFIGTVYILFNFTRLSWFSFIIGLITYMLLIDFSKWKIILSVGVLFSIIIITFASLNPNNPVSKKITGRIEENQAISINTLSSYRPILMKTAIDNVSESITSLIFGLGVKKAGEKSEAKLGHPYSAHNKFIDILQYSGAIGLLLYILYLLHVLILIFKTRNKSKEYSLLLTFSILAFLYLIPSHGLTIYSNLLFGALIAYNILLKESESDEKLIL